MISASDGATFFSLCLTTKSMKRIGTVRGAPRSRSRSYKHGWRLIRLFIMLRCDSRVCFKGSESAVRIWRRKSEAVTGHSTRRDSYQGQEVSFKNWLIYLHRFLFISSSFSDLFSRSAEKPKSFIKDPSEQMLPGTTTSCSIFHTRIETHC